MERRADRMASRPVQRSSPALASKQLTRLVDVCIVPRRTMLSTREELSQCTFAVRRKRNRAAHAIAPRPAQREDAIENRSAERTSEMMPPLAPVETCARERSSRIRQFFNVDSHANEERFSFRGQRAAIAAGEKLRRAQPVEQPHTALARKVVVAHAGDAKRRIRRAAAHARAARGDDVQLLEQRSDLVIEETEVAMPALSLHRDHAAAHKSRQMRARR